MESYFRFGFVEFESVEDAEEALKTCNNAVIEGRNIRLEFCQRREDKEAGKGNSGVYFQHSVPCFYPYLLTTSSAIMLTACFFFSCFFIIQSCKKSAIQFDQRLYPECA